MILCPPFFFLTSLFIFLSYHQLNAQYIINKNQTKLVPYKTFEFDTLSNGPIVSRYLDTLQNKQKTILLNEVNIYSRPTYKTDSLSLRKDFSPVFNYRRPTFTSIFSNTSSARSANSTSSILTLDVLRVVSLFGKKKDKTYKLQQLLIEEEKERYIDHIFSKSEIKKLTHLTDDSLTLFIEQYRAGIYPLEDQYNRLMYIKKSLAEFKKKTP
ncbi:hypothetical protein [Olivibacter domesticus]|uniref:Uncharacterized protein n=1 Tax=Olivibacter domesticus TaxID=407022 RepID=A0A1H7M9P1_OLID1|nr:hypothetical protein [Olivibacter domesticus]SEL07648.1 hypothetical protein SAMN05661044_01910 [Olivibacter domesticus]